MPAAKDLECVRAEIFTLFNNGLPYRQILTQANELLVVRGQQTVSLRALEAQLKSWGLNRQARPPRTNLDAFYKEIFEFYYSDLPVIKILEQVNELLRARSLHTISLRSLEKWFSKNGFTRQQPRRRASVNLGRSKKAALASSRAAQVVLAPARPALMAPPSRKAVFLAGTTSPTGEPDWRETLSAALAEFPVAIFNPLRPDWDATWREDFSDGRWAEQVHWELDMQDRADVVVVFLHGVSAAPISLLELGLCVRSGRAIVCARDGYVKRGNVEAVCARYGAPLVRTEEELRAAVVDRLRRLG